MSQQGSEGERSAPRLTRVRCVIAGDADQALDLVVMWLEVFISDRPIGGVGAGYLAVKRPQPQILAVQPEGVATHVYGAAADAAGDPSVGRALGCRLARAHDGMRFVERAGHEVVAPADSELVVKKVFAPVVRSFLEQAHTEARLRQRIRRCAAARTGADDDRVERLAAHLGWTRCGEASSGVRRCGSGKPIAFHPIIPALPP